jgi:hypothetical protein
MSKSSNSSQVLKLRAQIAALEEEKRILSEKLLDARRPISLPSGFYLEQDNNDNLIIHVPAQRSYNPITLPKDPILAFRIIQDIFLNRKVLPHDFGRASCPTQSMVDEWVKQGNKITTDRKPKIGGIVF